jgi:hypothetical protein
LAFGLRALGLAFALGFVFGFAADLASGLAFALGFAGAGTGAGASALAPAGSAWVVVSSICFSFTRVSIYPNTTHTLGNVLLSHFQVLSCCTVLLSHLHPYLLHHAILVKRSEISTQK